MLTSGRRTRVHPRCVGGAARHQRGLSLVELMVGIAVGLFVVAAASTVVATQLSDNRRLLLEVQVQQDLRATADIITRELRRAGSWQNSIADAGNGTWADGVEPMLNSNLENLTPLTGQASTVRFKSSRSRGADGPYGFTLVDGVISSWLTPTTTQQLTDPATVRVTTFRVTRENEPALRVTCNKLCEPSATFPGDLQYCWPTLVVRSFVVEITGVAVSDPSVKRSIRSEVRLRNDAINFNDPAHPTRACPV